MSSREELLESTCTMLRHVLDLHGFTEGEIDSAFQASKREYLAARRTNYPPGYNTWIARDLIQKHLPEWLPKKRKPRSDGENDE